MTSEVIVFIFLYFFAFYPAMFNAQNDSTSNRVLFRIVGGAETSIEKYPFMVCVLKKGFHHCGGTLYASDLVLTASHCVYSNDVWKKTGKMELYPANSLSVLIGSTYSKPEKDQDATRRQVSKIIEHKEFDFISYQNDIALLKLSEPVTYSTKIQPVKLISNTPPPGSVCTAIGWGISRPIGKNEAITGRGEEKLHRVDLPVISQKQCRGWIKATHQNLCTYTEGKDACVGDSGGPLICSGVQAGITSYGVGCAVKEKPGVYQRVDIHFAWLRMTTANSSAGGRLPYSLLLALHAVALLTTTRPLQYNSHLSSFLLVWIVLGA